MRGRCCGSRTAGNRSTQQCERYLRWLDKEAKDLGEELPFYSDKLSTRWEQFCDPAERIKHTIPFLESVIEQLPRAKDDVRIFDAATGIAIETTELIKRGYFVAANEIETSLRASANRFATSRGVRIPAARFSKTDWLHLREEHDPGSYDLVLVLGNSLRHLEGVDQLKKAVAELGRLLRPGGALICDERNFDYILRNWSAIRDDPWNAFRFNQRPFNDRVMYYGDSLLGAPKAAHRTRAGSSSTTRKSHEEESVKRTLIPEGDIGTLSMYPFKKGEMLGILRESGQLGRVDVYSDLSLTTELRDDADFFTYVAWAP